MVKSDLDLTAIASGKIKEDEANLLEIRQDIHGWFEAQIPHTIIDRGQAFTCVVVVSPKWKDWGNQEGRSRGGTRPTRAQADLSFPSLFFPFPFRWSLEKGENWIWFVALSSILLRTIHADSLLCWITHSCQK